MSTGEPPRGLDGHNDPSTPFEEWSEVEQLRYRLRSALQDRDTLWRARAAAESRLAEVEAERDALLEDVPHLDSLTLTYLRPSSGETPHALRRRAEAERDEAIAEREAARTALAGAREGLAAANPYWRIRSDRFEAQVEAWRPVVEAARAWRETFVHTSPADWDRAGNDLIAAVDALPKGGTDA